MNAIRWIRRRNSRKAVVIFIVAIVLPLMIIFAGFAIDASILFVSRAHLQASADLASLSGALSLPNENAATVTAERVLTRNGAGPAGTLETPDHEIEYGRWLPATRTFLLGQKPANATRVAVSTPVQLYFLTLLGTQSITVSTSATAYSDVLFTGFGTGGIIGIEWVDAGGVFQLDGYDAAKPYGEDGNSGLPGSILSNGWLTVRGNAHILGDARPGIEQTEANVQGSAIVDGDTYPLREVMQFTPVSLPVEITAASNNNNLATGTRPAGKSGIESVDPIDAALRLDIPANGTTAHLPPGDYYLSGMRIAGPLTIEGPARVRVSGDAKTTANGAITVTGGPVEMYLEGDADFVGQAFVNVSQIPGNLKIMTVGESAKFAGTSDFFGYIYGPNTAINIGGTNEFFGGAVGRTVNLTGTGGIHADTGGGWDGPNTHVPYLVN